MDEPNNGQQTHEPAGTEPTEPGTQEPTPDNGNGQEDQAAELARLRSTNAQLHARATKAEAELKRRPASAPAAGSQDLPPEAATKDDVDTATLVAKGYSDDEIESLRILAKGAGKRLRDVTGMPEAKAIVDAKRAQKQSRDATPSPSSRPAATKPGQKAFSQMTEEERRANFGAVVDRHSRRGHSSAR